MPKYVVEHQGKKYQVEADTPEHAAAAFDSPAPAAEQGPRADGLSTEAAPRGAVSPGSGGFAPNVASDLGSGIVEGGKRLKAGAEQLAGNVSDFFTGKDKAGRGAGTMATETENLRQLLDSEDAKAQGQDMRLREAGAQATQLGTLAVAPEAGLPRATTLLGGLAKNALAGGIGGAAEFNPEGGSAKGAAIGAGGGAVLGTAFALAPAIKNRIAKAVLSSTEGSRTAASMANAETVMPGMKASLSQRTGIPELKTLERAAYNSKMTQFYADQTDDFVKKFVDTMSTPVPPGTTVDGAFLNAKTRADGQLRQAKVASSDSYEAGMSKAAVMEHSGAVPVGGVKIPTNDLTQQVQYMQQLQSDTLANGGSNALPPAWLESVSQAAGKGYFTPKEVASFLRGATAAGKAGNDVERANVGRLRDAFERDLDNLGQTANSAKVDEVTQQILDTRAEYRRSREAIGMMADSAAFKLMGVSNPDVGAEGLLKRFNEFSPARQREVQGYLQNNSPDLLAAMKQKVVTDAQQSAKSLGEAADSRQSLDQLADNLFDEKRGFDLRSSGLFNAEELKKVEAFKDGLRVIRNNRPGVGGGGTPIKPEDIVINVVSRSGEFASRQLARVLMSAEASKVFTDPDVYKAMTKLDRSTTGSAGNLAARTLLLKTLLTKYPEQQEQQPQ
jgi:hypothetical protein